MYPDLASCQAAADAHPTFMEDGGYRVLYAHFARPHPYLAISESLYQAQQNEIDKEYTVEFTQTGLTGDPVDPLDQEHVLYWSP